mgnify:CR=1 FL=1
MGGKPAARQGDMTRKGLDIVWRGFWTGVETAL